MGPKEQGRLLRAWRKYVGYTLEAAAEKIDRQAEAEGIDKNERGVPRTHASLVRWEMGQIKSHKLEGLGVIARTYGLSVTDLFVDPPEKGGSPAAPAAREDDEGTVALFREFLKTRR